MNVVEITRRQPVCILAWMRLPPMESYGPARGAAGTPALQAWNTAVALGKIAPRYAGKARPLGEIGRVRAPPGEGSCGDARTTERIGRAAAERPPRLIRSTESEGRISSRDLRLTKRRTAIYWRSCPECSSSPQGYAGLHKSITD